MCVGLRRVIDTERAGCLFAIVIVLVGALVHDVVVAES